MAVRALEQAQAGGSGGVSSRPSADASLFSAGASLPSQRQQDQPPAAEAEGGGSSAEIVPEAGEEEPPMPPLLPISSLSFPRHNGQPLALGATGTTKVGRNCAWLTSLALL
jgi:hypothetical protein